jgi:putative transposase
MEIQSRLYEYLGGILRANKGVLLAAGGMPDHVHLLARLLTTAQPMQQRLQL